MIFIQKGVGGVFKSPPQPGADCEGKIHTVLQYLLKSRLRYNKFLSMLGTAAEDEEYEEATAPSYSKNRIRI